MSRVPFFRLYQRKDDAFPDHEHAGTVNEDSYDLACEGALLKGMSLSDVCEELRRKPRSLLTKHAFALSDVVTLHRKEGVECYFNDTVGLIRIDGFFVQRLTADTSGFTIDGVPGLWFVADTCSVEGKTFFLMENEKHGRRLERVILDAAGQVVMTDNRYDFDDDAISRIRAFLHPKPELEHYQKYFENGEYERHASEEVTEEANYSLIDGNNNNPRRRSVRERLNEKLALIHGTTNKREERIK